MLLLDPVAVAGLQRLFALSRSDLDWLLRSDDITPADITDIVTLREDPDELQAVWLGAECYDEDEFIVAVRILVERDCRQCDRCADFIWLDEAVGGTLCNSCFVRHFTVCDTCEAITPDDDIRNVSGRSLCEDCCDNYTSWCDTCEERYFDDDSEDHEHPQGCSCEAPVMRFQFPGNGDGPIDNDETYTVTLPAGHIDEEGINRIADTICTAVVKPSEDVPPGGHDYAYWELRTAVWATVEKVEPVWMAGSTYTRRVAKALYKEHGLKIPPAVVSEVGNIAKQHSSDTASWDIEFTRRLNMSADEFCNDESCWWGSYYPSRCGLKNWGGIGLRSFSRYDIPSGRAWIQPLDVNLRPTHDAIGAHAYLVYNTYGDLDGYIATRMVAHLTGRTYRRVDISVYTDDFYVNGDSAHLVADAETCTNVDRVTFDWEVHNRFDAGLVLRRQQEAHAARVAAAAAEAIESTQREEVNA